MLFLKFSLLVTVADIVTHFSSLVLFESDLTVILANRTIITITMSMPKSPMTTGRLKGSHSEMELAEAETTMIVPRDRSTPAFSSISFSALMLFI